MKYKSFHPGQPWLDTNGKRIHAHGGSIFYENGRYYWYGENKEKTTGLDSIWHWGIRCYVSGDLYNWDDLGLIIPPEPDDPASTLHPSKCVDRPHILYNRKIRLLAEGHVRGLHSSDCGCAAGAIHRRTRGALAAWHGAGRL